MENCKFLSNFEKIHFVGVGGVSMSALANYSILNIKLVSGSDLNFSERTDKLSKLGCEIKIGHTAKNVRGADAVVYTVATDIDNPEIRYAKKKGIPIFARGEFLGSIMKEYKNSVAISGCHGKTTTTAMIASVMISAGKDPTVFLGGDHKDFGNFRLGKSDVAITEACEYKKSFLNIFPKIAVVLNIGDDHLDTYGSIEGVINAFSEFIGKGISVVNADDINARKVLNDCSVTFGINNTACYYATDIKFNGKFYSFNLNAYSKKYGRVTLKTLGKHNIYNALATFAVCDILGIEFSKIKKGLEEFRGVKRRNEYIGSRNGVDFYADYAHHPVEISATIGALKESGEKFFTVFQPHTYSRTKFLMSEFVDSLKNVNPIIIYKTYPAREEYDKDGSAFELFNNLEQAGAKEIYYADNENELISSIEKSSNGLNKGLILGAGDIYDKVKQFLV